MSLDYDPFPVIPYIFSKTFKEIFFIPDEAQHRKNSRRSPPPVSSPCPSLLSIHFSPEEPLGEPYLAVKAGIIPTKQGLSTLAG